MKALPVPIQHQDKFPLEWKNLRIELVEDAFGNFCLTKSAFDWKELRDRVRDSNNQNIKDKWNTLKTWVQNQIDAGKLIDFVPKPSEV